MLARPAKHTFIQHMDNGLAKMTLRVWRGALTIGATVQAFAGMSSHLARGSAARGPGARLRGEGQLEPDGSINQLRLDVELDDLPALGPLEQAELDRLKGSFIELIAGGTDKQAHADWSEAHASSVQRRPVIPLMFMVALLTDLERQATMLLGAAPPTSRSSMMTLHDLLDGAVDAEVTNPVQETENTRLIWLDDQTPALDVDGRHADDLTALNSSFRRLLAYLPEAWRCGRRRAS